MILFTSTEIQRRVEVMAVEIGTAPVHLVVVLSGAFIFAADLIRHLDATIEFVTASSYRDAQISSGEVGVTMASTPLTGRDVLIVEDIVDTGRTITTVLTALTPRNPTRIRVASLLDKPSRRVVPARVDFVGFTVPDIFVFGYGMDNAGMNRCLPDIWGV